MAEAGPQRDLPEHDETTDRVAERRPEGISAPTYAEVALKLLDQGYEPLPILPGQKRPSVTNWTRVAITEEQVEAWCQTFPDCGVGLRTGHLVGFDLDILDPDQAHQARAIVERRLGKTLIRVGRWPKQLLLYRTERPFAKFRIGKVEVLGLGQQFVAFGIHPDIGKPYYWPEGETPLDRAHEDLPLVTELEIETVLAELAPIAGSASSGSRKAPSGTTSEITRDATGRVTDGRDDWLSRIAFHALHDAIDRGEEPDEAALAEQVWARFEVSTDLTRPRQDGQRGYGPADARRKLRDKLRLQRDGNLPDRKRPPVEPGYIPPGLGAGAARKELDQVLQNAMEAVTGWHRAGGVGEAPRLGIRATVGLGKSTAARRHITGLMRKLADEGLPHRILILVPSLKLADESAAAWAGLGTRAVVLRGYEAPHPVSKDPMCRDIPAVRAAVEARYDIQSSVCSESGKRRCAMFATCAKQANRRAVEEAEVVVAAYDTMFTGFAGDTEDFALVVVDEACWQRSFEVSDGLTIEALPQLGISGVAPSRRQDAEGAAIADVVMARRKLSNALAALPSGEVTRDALLPFGIDATFCSEARASEYAALPVVHLSPGQGLAERKLARERSTQRALGLQVIGLWSALMNLLDRRPESTAKLWLGAMGKTGQRPIRIFQRKVMAAELARLPLLHLDATLRPDLAQVVLPGLAVRAVEAHAPHQHVRLISGSFGKGNLCPDPRGGAETQRRENRLKEVVDYVRWHALRHPGKRILVITYKAIESAFAGIPGVETAHYNAVAGLDGWGDVAALFLIGRPLPASGDLSEMTGALFDRSVRARDYSAMDVGVVIAGGRPTAIRAIRHADPTAEIIRAAICDDEVMQTLGRGRGVNRTATNPLEVHLMADVVLPIEHDRVIAWDLVCPDIVQRMLLAGLAVDSPADAAKLHPGLFADEKQAQKALERAGFKRQNPIENSYREMSLKSAAYRLGGRGRGWQRVWWVSCAEEAARATLEATIGPVSEWVFETGG